MSVLTLYIVLILTTFACTIPNTAYSQETERYGVCKKPFGQGWARTEQGTREYLLELAKQKLIRIQIIQDLLTGMVEEERIDIEIYSTRFLEIIPSKTRYKNGDEFGQLCVEIEGFISPVNKPLFTANKIPSTYCAKEGTNVTDFKNKAIYKIIDLVSNDINAIDIEKDSLDIHAAKSLVHNVKVLNNYRYDDERDIYCMTIEGLVYPLQLKFFAEKSGSDPTACTSGMVTITTSNTNICIDPKEVSNSDFPGDPEALDDLPRVNVSWNDANNYCLKQGKRHPTEAEWTIAVRGRATGVIKNDNNIKEWVDIQSHDNRKQYMSMDKKFDGKSFSRSKFSVIGFRCAKSLIN